MKKWKEDRQLTLNNIAAIHYGLRLLAKACDGAITLDGTGFSKADTYFGRSLADCPHLSYKQAIAGLHLVRKYRRQLPKAVLVGIIEPSAMSDGTPLCQYCCRGFEQGEGEDLRHHEAECDGGSNVSDTGINETEVDKS